MCYGRQTVKALDTSEAAAAVHEDVMRSAGPIARLKSALDLSDLTHAFAVAGIRQRHPGMNEDEARRELARMLYLR
jgi:hypothetical protein